MQIHDLTQGSAEWLAYRATHFNASDAPAMMGVSPYKTRSQLLHEMHTGLTAEVDAGTQARFDDGHRFEALARPRAEQLVGEDLYPVVASLGKLSASFDGLTMAEDTVFEHKTLNADIAAAASAADLGEHLRIQMEQQLHVSGASRCLFLATKWDGDQLVDERHFWYEPNLLLRAAVLDGWKQFEADLLAYVPAAASAPKSTASAIMEFPVLHVQTRGEVVKSNLPQFKEHADRFIAAIKTTLETDQDFADAEETVKFCDRAEKSLEQTKASAIAQTASIDDLMRTIDHIQAQLRTKRLTLEKLVKSEKEARKEKILAEGKAKYAEHLAALDAEVAPVRLNLAVPDFAGAMKGKRTIASLADAVDTTLATAKIAANAAAADLRAKKAWYAGAAAEYLFLFDDLAALVVKSMDDFKLVVETRIANHKQVEQEKADRLAEESRARIQREEQAKAEATAREVTVPAANHSEITKKMLAAAAPILSRAFSGETSNSAPSLRLGQITQRLGFTVTADFLSSLGFAPAATDKSAKLYHEHDFKAICAALLRHISAVAAAH